MSRNSTKAPEPKVTTTDEPEAANTESTESAPAVLVDEVMVATYKAATDAKGRSAVRKLAESARDAAIKALDLPTAQLYLSTLDALKVDSAVKAESTPAHVTLAHRVRALLIAAELLIAGSVVPEGLGEVDRVQFTELWSNGFDTTDEIKAAGSKLATSKITRSTESTNSAEYIVRAFDGAEVGTVKTIANVRRDGVTEGVPLKSPGAIRACMEGQSAPSGYELVVGTTENPYSIRFVGTE